MSDAHEGGLAAFRERLAETMKAADAGRVSRMVDRDDTMRQREEAQRIFLEIAGHLVDAEISPRVQLIADGFPNTAVEHGRTATGMHVRCRFGRNDRFLASVQLSIGVLLDAELRGGSLTYGVEIVPVLVSMEQSAHVDFPLASPDTAALIAWVEGRLLAFLHFYLGLETDTHYQRTDSAVDPVCGMRLTPATACTRIAEHAHTWYFCSDACRTRFEADRDLYVKQDGHWRAVGTATGAPGVDGVGP